jgi:hypothetical protein
MNTKRIQSSDVSPVGTGVHDTSRLPMPALSNWTFSGSPGHAVSKHHKSLQHTSKDTWRVRSTVTMKHVQTNELDCSKLFYIRHVHSKWTFSCWLTQHNGRHELEACSRLMILDREVPKRDFLTKIIDDNAVYSKNSSLSCSTVILPRLNAANVFVHFHSFSFAYCSCLSDEINGIQPPNVNILDDWTASKHQWK